MVQLRTTALTDPLTIGATQGLRRELQGELFLHQNGHIDSRILHKAEVKLVFGQTNFRRTPDFYDRRLSQIKAKSVRQLERHRLETSRARKPRMPRKDSSHRNNAGKTLEVHLKRYRSGCLRVPHFRKRLGDKGRQHILGKVQTIVWDIIHLNLQRFLLCLPRIQSAQV